MVSFAADIQPLFRNKDVDAMSFMFDLSSYGDVKANAQEIYEVVKSGAMPCDSRWTESQVMLLKQWLDGGMPE